MQTGYSKAQIAESNLRRGAVAYLKGSIRLYVALEGRVSVHDDSRFADCANMVCCLARAMEQLLKLSLVKVDPVLLFPMPKSADDYWALRQIGTARDTRPDQRLKELLTRTVPYKEALARVDLTHGPGTFDFSCFQQIYSLRNGLEHHWERNEAFLQKVMSSMSSRILPCLQAFITEVLCEDPGVYLDDSLLAEVARLDRALAQNHSLALQQRLETYQEQYASHGPSATEQLAPPNEYARLPAEPTEVVCPVCSTRMHALWDWEADYDVDPHENVGFITGIFADVKCLCCHNCGFYADGWDVEAYLPDGLDIEPEPDDSWP